MFLFELQIKTMLNSRHRSISLKIRPNYAPIQYLIGTLCSYLFIKYKITNSEKNKYI